MSCSKITVVAVYGFVLSFALLLAANASLQASVITLSGGDPGEGYTPYAHGTLYAYHYAQAVVPLPETVQGVVFAPINTNIYPNGYPTSSFPYQFTRGNSNEYNGFPIPTFPGPVTANDTALAAMMRDGTYGPTSLTLTGLHAGWTYQVDIIAESNSDARLGTMTFNGGQADVLSEANGVVYDVNELVVANGSGQIVVALTNDTNNPSFMAFSVSNPVPEPSSMVLIGVGALTLFGVIRRRRGSKTRTR